jgi:hypothetical protein
MTWQNSQEHAFRQSVLAFKAATQHGTQQNKKAL